MARAKRTARKHIRTSPCRNVVHTKSNSDGQNAGYFLRTLWTILLALGYSEPPLFVSVPRLLRGNSYLWCVCVSIYEKPMTDHIHHIRHVVEATTPRWTFKGGMREAA
jgi:5-methylcytosine-specific restriction endonuclease McrA